MTVSSLFVAAKLAGLTGQNEDQNVGIKVALRAMEAPLRQIVSNAGEEPSVVANNVKAGEGNYGYNAATEEYGNMIDMGILDPTKVTRSALQYAASVAGLMITTECMVTDLPKGDAPDLGAAGGMGGMGGMDPNMFAADQTLTLNANNALVKYLFEHKDSEHSGMFAEQLYDLAMLSNQPLSAEAMTKFVKRSNDIMLLLTK